MAESFEVGDHVDWASEASHVSGVIIAVRTPDFDYKGHIHRAAPKATQYLVKSDWTDHVAAHKGSALRHIR